MRSKVAEEMLQLRTKLLEAIADEPARYQTEVATTISFCTDHLLALARIHEMVLEVHELNQLNGRLG
jgi:hypothetical protein